MNTIILSIYGYVFHNYKYNRIMQDDNSSHFLFSSQSFGCIITELMTGLPIFGGVKSYRQQLRNIFNIFGSPSEAEW